MELELGQLAALGAVVDEGTFEAAARRLHVTPSAISQRLRALEQRAGQVVVVRSRPVRTTPAGEVLLRLARQVETLRAEATAALGGPTAGPGVTPMSIAVNADSLSTWLLPALAPLADRFAFDVRRADQADTAGLLREGTVMAAVTTDAEAVAGCSTEVLGRMRYRPVASPAFVARWFPRGVDRASLQRAPVIVFDRADDLQHRWLRARGVDPTAPPVHCIPSTAEILTAAQWGLGWAMVPVLQARAPEQSGSVVALTARSVVDVVLHWQQWRLGSAALDELADAVRVAARAGLDRPARRPGRDAPAG